MKFSVRNIEPRDRDGIIKIVQGWGADFIVTRGRCVKPQDMPGFLAVDKRDMPLGMATYEIIGDQCELVTLDAFTRFEGIGTALLMQVAKVARDSKCKRLWLITTNDNIEAIRFYQKRQMIIAAVHINALARSRELKPAIPLIGMHGIPLRDEIEFELMLGE